MTVLAIDYGTLAHDIDGARIKGRIKGVRNLFGSRIRGVSNLFDIVAPTFTVGRRIKSVRNLFDIVAPTLTVEKVPDTFSSP
jgi:hypothetical protein